MKNIAFIRHGRTAASGNRFYCGATNLPLLENGVKELFELKEKGVYPAVDACFSSPALRARHTARLLFDADKPILLPELWEYNFGEFETFTHEQLCGRKDYMDWISDETGEIPCTGGESRARFRQRISGALQTVLLRTKDGGISAVVCHAGVISELMRSLFGGGFYDWHTQPGRGYLVMFGAQNTYEKI